ncbi:Asp23/Gls24 family envelope stress response protein [Kineococcus endophyticus]
MSEQTKTTPKAMSTPGSSTLAVSRDDVPTGALVSNQGTTSIADTVVSKIAGLAAKDVSGVHALGGGASRAVGALRERIPGGRVNHSQGVSVEVGETQAAVDINLIAEYGVAIADLAAGVRRNVIASVERMTGLQVTEVNIAVADVHLPDEDADDNEDSDSAPRVR